MSRRRPLGKCERCGIMPAALRFWKADGGLARLCFVCLPANAKRIDHCVYGQTATPARAKSPVG